MTTDSTDVVPYLTRRRRAFWSAQGLAEGARTRFENARTAKVQDSQEIRSAFYQLTHFYARTLHILRSAWEERDEPLAEAALKNLVVLDGVLSTMHRQEPDRVPLAIPLFDDLRTHFTRDLIIRAHQEAQQALTPKEITELMDKNDLMGQVRYEQLDDYLDALVTDGYLSRGNDGTKLTKQPYSDLNMDAAMYQSILGPELAGTMQKQGFRGLGDVVARQKEWLAEFPAATGYSTTIAARLIDVARAFQDESDLTDTPRRHKDLIHSGIPRPYQLEAYAVFRGYGYDGVVVEAPTGSGKTLIGMMCIQDWFRTLPRGRTILVLVPTTNYQQQWVGELCYNPFGLELSPELVFAGTPTALDRYQHQTGDFPAVTLLTYTALAQMSTVDGVFNPDVVRDFLSDERIEYVMLDEAHKVVEDLDSASAQVVKVVTATYREQQLRGVVGFTGTASAYRSRFEQLGLKLVHIIPALELIAYGYVAPFVEFGIPFAYSERERQVRELLDAYKEQVRRFTALAGVESLRAQFAAIPIEQRVRIARDWLGIYADRADGDSAARSRLQQWESGKTEMPLTEVPLVQILQAATGKTDSDLIPADQQGAFQALLAEIEQVRVALQDLLFLPETVEMLRLPNFGTALDTATLEGLHDPTLSENERLTRAAQALSTTIAGLYDVLSAWYRRMGEGRVSAIKATIAAEEAERDVSGIIVFDRGRRIQWKRGTAAPGYDGVAGLFSEMLGDSRHLPIAVLSSEIYLPYMEDEAVTHQVAGFIEQRMMMENIGEAMQELVLSGLDAPHAVQERFRKKFTALLEELLPDLAAGRPRYGMFNKAVLAPLRAEYGRKSGGFPPQSRSLLRSRLRLRYPHLRALITTFFDYSGLARLWRDPIEAELRQASGKLFKFSVIPMPGGRRKQLMYELTARLVDEPTLPIDLIIVSNWARTGWNVISPNVLIDATATRDVTAWQQLRGRAMRALRTWNNTCYRLEAVLLGTRALGLEAEEGHLPPDVHEVYQELLAQADQPVSLDDKVQKLLTDLLTNAEEKRFAKKGMAAFSNEERLNLAVRLLTTRNKVTHIFELVKAVGSPAQIVYDRPRKQWIRREEIAQKHAYEVSVHPKTGELLRGDAHAPLLFGEDPRHDPPTLLEKAIRAGIEDCDPVVVTGWLRAVMNPDGAAEDIALTDETAPRGMEMDE
jgi:hypothetical protein